MKILAVLYALTLLLGTSSFANDLDQKIYSDLKSKPISCEIAKDCFIKLSGPMVCVDKKINGKDDYQCIFSKNQNNNSANCLGDLWKELAQKPDVDDGLMGKSYLENEQKFLMTKEASHYTVVLGSASGNGLYFSGSDSACDQRALLSEYQVILAQYFNKSLTASLTEKIKSEAFGNHPETKPKHPQAGTKASG